MRKDLFAIVATAAMMFLSGCGGGSAAQTSNPNFRVQVWHYAPNGPWGKVDPLTNLRVGDHIWASVDTVTRGRGDINFGGIAMTTPDGVVHDNVQFDRSGYVLTMAGQYKLAAHIQTNINTAVWTVINVVSEL